MPHIVAQETSTLSKGTIMQNDSQIGILVLSRETGNPVDEPVLFDSTTPIVYALATVYNMIFDGMECTLADIDNWYRFEIVL